MSDRGPFRLVPYFSSIRFDRDPASRNDASRLNALKSDSATRHAVVWRGRHLMIESARPALARLTLRELGASAGEFEGLRRVFLGRDEHGPLFGLDLSPLHTPPQPAGHVYAELRPYEFLLDKEDAAVAAQFRGLVLAGDEAGSPQRLDPVAVVLPVNGDRVLLARGKGSPNPKLMSALSAFVEPGEMAEQAAAREVEQELGLRARRLQYHSSQPWPFPNMLMLGFHLQTQTTDLASGFGKIAEARWFSREDIFNHEALGFDVPDARTLAGQLLKRWMMCGDMFGDYVPPAPARVADEAAVSYAAN